MLNIGETLENRYYIQEEIGKGGIGIIYKAWDLHLQKAVVLKKIKDTVLEVTDIRSEADILKHLHHSYLPQVYDFVEAGSDVYTVIQYIEGHDLQYYLERKEVFSEQRLQKWLYQLCDALDYLHTRRPPVLHCDIKPANIMLTPSDDICLIDFNISLNYEKDVDLKGISQVYCSPEQYERALGDNSKKLDGRTDIYSLGATFYTLLTGCYPTPDIRALNPLSFFETPYSNGLTSIIETAMNPRQSRRYQSASQMKKAVMDMRKYDRVSRQHFRHTIAVAALSTVLLVSGVLCCLYGVGKNRRQAFVEDYALFAEYCKSQNYEEAVRMALSILNESDYSRSLKEEALYAELLEKTGECCFSMGDYGQAADFFSQALEADDDNSQYCRNYAAALARDGDFHEARLQIRTAERKGLPPEEVSLLRAEVAIAENDWAEAEGYLQSLEESSSDRLVLEETHVLQARLCEQQNDVQTMIYHLREALKYRESVSVYRNLMAGLLRMAQEDETWAVLQEALECCEKAEEIAGVNAIDELNKAIVLRAMGEYGSSRDILEKLIKNGGADYRVYYNLALVLYKMNPESLSDGVKKDISAYCERALQLYEPDLDKSGEDKSQLEELLRLVS